MTQPNNPDALAASGKPMADGIMSAMPHSYPYTLDFIGNRLYGDNYKCLPHTRKEIIDFLKSRDEAIRNAALEEAAEMAGNQHLFSWAEYAIADIIMGCQKAMAHQIRSLKTRKEGV